MHRLVRGVRFCIDPFLTESCQGFNSYAGKPCGQGLSFFFVLWTELVGEVNPETGFVVNVVDVDRAVRQYVIPFFTEYIREKCNLCKHITINDITGLIVRAIEELKGKFSSTAVSKLCLELNPYRKIAVKAEDRKVFYYSEKFEFAAMHTLWNNSFSDEKNHEIFGKCANPKGHGHNYVAEVTVKTPADRDLSIADFERIVNDEFISLVDHKNLNADVDQFSKVIPTVENISSYAWERLKGKFKTGQLTKITIWETDKTFCSYSE